MYQVAEVKESPQGVRQRFVGDTRYTRAVDAIAAADGLLAWRRRISHAKWRTLQVEVFDETGRVVYAAQ